MKSPVWWLGESKVIKSRTTESRLFKLWRVTQEPPTNPKGARWASWLSAAEPGCGRRRGCGEALRRSSGDQELALVQASPLRLPPCPMGRYLGIWQFVSATYSHVATGQLCPWSYGSWGLPGILTIIFIDTKCKEHKINHFKVNNSFRTFTKWDNHSLSSSKIHCIFLNFILIEFWN